MTNPTDPWIMRAREWLDEHEVYETGLKSTDLATFARLECARELDEVADNITGLDKLGLTIASVIAGLRARAAALREGT